MNKSSKLAILAIIISISIAIFLAAPSEEIPENSQPTETLNKDIKKEAIALKIAGVEQSGDLPKSFSACKEFNQQYERQLRNWRDHFVEDADKLLEQGYNADQITLVIEHFSNTNFASDWRLNFLKKNARLTQENSNLRNKVESQLGEDLPAYFRIRQKFPQPNLTDYENMNPQARLAAIAESAPRVDDVAVFIRNKQLDDNDLIELIKSVENPSEMVATPDTRGPIYLLELATQNKKYKLVKYLLERNIKPFEDSYLPNVLEYAIATLSSNFHDPEMLSNNVKLIRELVSMGLTARHHMTDKNTIKPWINSLYYRLNAQEQEYLQINYDLDLLAIAKEKQSDSKADISALILQVNRQKSDYLDQQYGIFTYQTAYENCRDLNQKITKTWGSNSAFFSWLTHDLKQKYGANDTAIEAELAKYDPDAIDCHRKNLLRQTSYQHKQENGELHKAFYSADELRMVDQRTFLSQLQQSFSLSADDKNWIFYQSIYAGNMQDILILQEQGITHNQLNFYQLNWRRFSANDLALLNDIGFDTTTADKFGKTALYFAAKSFNIELLEYMWQNNYPYSNTDNSQDALHITLASWKSRYTSETALKALKILFRFNPSIDEFHLARMKVIKLRDPNFYEAIIADYPALKAGEETPYPRAVCSF